MLLKSFSSKSPGIPEMAEFYKIGAVRKADLPYLWYMFVATADGIGSLKEEDYGDRSIGLSGAGIALRQFRDKNPDAIGAYVDWGLLQYGWAVADAVLGGSGILKAEKNVTWMPEQRFLDYRRSLGKGEPLRVVVTGRGFDAEEMRYPIFKQNGFRTLVATSKMGMERMESEMRSMPEQDRPRVEIKAFGDERVDLASMLKYLRRERDIKKVDFEGGPDLAGQLLKARLIDEYRLTTSPAIAGSLNSKGLQRPGPFKGSFSPDELPVMELLKIGLYGSHTFNRYKFRYKA